MGLKALTHAAVAKAAVALGDMAISLTLRKRTKADYVPGSPQAYVTTDTTVKGVITRYRQEEVDGTQIQGIDLLIVIFPPSNSAIPEANDIVIHGDKQYKVVGNTPVYVGSEIAVNLVQARPPV